MVEDNACFVISPIGSPESATRERADHVFEYVIEEALEDFEYTPIRADHIAEPGIITNDVMEYIVESSLVIADLTDSNANVFYELAIRHAYEKPTIQIIEEGEDIPFDLASTRTITFDHSNVGSVSNAKAAIMEQIESINDESESYENPITVAEDIRDLKQSSDPEERSMAELMENISDLRSDMRSIEKMVNNPKEMLPPEYVSGLFNTISDERLSRLNEMMIEIEDLSYEIIDAAEADEDGWAMDDVQDLADEQSAIIADLIHELEMIKKNRKRESEKGLSDFI